MTSRTIHLNVMALFAVALVASVVQKGTLAAGGINPMIFLTLTLGDALANFAVSGMIPLMMFLSVRFRAERAKAGIIVWWVLEAVLIVLVLAGLGRPVTDG